MSVLGKKCSSLITIVDIISKAMSNVIEPSYRYCVFCCHLQTYSIDQDQEICCLPSCHIHDWPVGLVIQDRGPFKLYTRDNPIPLICLLQIHLAFYGCVTLTNTLGLTSIHNDVTKWKHFARYWPFVSGIHRSQINPPHKGKWRRALMFVWSAPE